MNMTRGSLIKKLALIGLLANPEDDHTVMVFTEGTRGETDQSLFKFVKPE